MDRRLTPANAQVALEALRGLVPAERFTAGEAATVALPVADLCCAPDGKRDRQLLWGETITVINRDNGWAFVQAKKDGYCGYVPAGVIGPEIVATHRVGVLSSHIYSGPRVQAPDLANLSFGSEVTVTGVEGKFSIIPQGYIPSVHLRPVESPFTDPVGVAELFLGAPYLWGGNSHMGIDCSGLVQAALLACGIPCPGDSDLQQAVGTEVASGQPSRRGDLLFWKGHVAIVVDAERLIHANGHSMSVAYEETRSCIDRIMAQEGRPVLMRRRP